MHLQQRLSWDVFHSLLQRPAHNTNWVKLPSCVCSKIFISDDDKKTKIILENHKYLQNMICKSNICTYKEDKLFNRSGGPILQIDLKNKKSIDIKKTLYFFNSLDTQIKEFAKTKKYIIYDKSIIDPELFNGMDKELGDLVNMPLSQIVSTYRDLQINNEPDHKFTKYFIFFLVLLYEQRIDILLKLHQLGFNFDKLLWLHISNYATDGIMPICMELLVIYIWTNCMILCDDINYETLYKMVKDGNHCFNYNTLLFRKELNNEMPYYDRDVYKIMIEQLKTNNDIVKKIFEIIVIMQILNDKCEELNKNKEKSLWYYPYWHAINKMFMGYNHEKFLDFLSEASF